MEKKRFLDRSLFKNISTVSIFDLASKASNFILMILLINVLSVEDYALFTVFISISAAINGAISNGLNLSYIRYDVELFSRKGRYSSLFIINLILKISIITLIIVFYYFFEKHLNSISENLEMVFYYAIFYTVGLTLLGTLSSYFQVREKYVQNGIILNIKNLLILFVCILTYYFFSLDFQSVAFNYILVSCAFLPVVVFIIVKSNFVKVHKRTIIDFFKTSSWLLIYSFFISLLSQIDIFMVSIFLTEYEVANFGVAFRYYGILLSLLPSIAIVLRIRTSKKDMIDNKNNQREFILNWIKTTPRIIVPFVILCISIAPFGWSILNGDSYSGAIIPFQILSIGAAISYIFSPNVAVAMAMKKYRLLCIVTVVALCLNVVGNILIINVFGIIGVAIITVLSHAFLNIFIVIYILNKLPRNYST